ncbi:MAG: outer membrane beta-barrel protein [Gemmatimonadaceae bacterium]
MLNGLLRKSFIAVLVSLGIGNTPLSAQGHPQERHGFWLTLGLGAGSLGCDECSSRSTGVSGQLSLGGTITPRLLLGASSNGWTKQESGVTLSMGTLTALVKFYPVLTGGFYLSGGLGIANISASTTGFGSASQTGTGAVLGLGYDIRVAKNFSLTPYLNGVGASFDGSQVNFSQIGLGFSWH